MRDPKDCDAVFKTGLILCNMLLREDGFHDIGDWESDWLETDYGKDTQRVAARVATASAADYERELELTDSNADTVTPYHARKRALMVNYVQMHKRGLVGWLKPARSVRLRKVVQ